MKIKTSPVLDINGKMNHQNKWDDCPHGSVAALMRNASNGLFSKDIACHWLVEVNETDPPHCAPLLSDPSLQSMANMVVRFH